MNFCIPENIKLSNFREFCGREIFLSFFRNILLQKSTKIVFQDFTTLSFQTMRKCNNETEETINIKTFSRSEILEIDWTQNWGLYSLDPPQKKIFFSKFFFLLFVRKSLIKCLARCLSICGPTEVRDYRGVTPAKKFFFQNFFFILFVRKSLLMRWEMIMAFRWR
jgi:hypothetical protein